MIQYIDFLVQMIEIL